MRHTKSRQIEDDVLAWLQEDAPAGSRRGGQVHPGGREDLADPGLDEIVDHCRHA